MSSIRGKGIHDWRQKANAMLAAIDELRLCFANMFAIAESLDEKMQGHDQVSLKVLLQEIIQITKDMEGKLSCIYHACGLLAQSCDDKRQANLSGIDNEKLPDFSEYVLKKYSVELEEDLVTMIEDLIERQREEVKLIEYRTPR